MRILVTGATGFIGVNLTLELAKKGFTVNALYRDEGKTKLLQHKNIKLYRGNILDTESLNKAMKSCDFVFHLAAYAKVWSKNPDTFYKVNFTGTENILKSAQKCGVNRVIVTSTAGVFGPSSGKIVDENTNREASYFNDYEKTKALMEELVKRYVAGGQDIVIVNPTRVFGPGILSDSNGVAKLIILYMTRKFGIMPGSGKSKGNYAYVDDVVNGFILAMEKGIAGERYILGGENISYSELYNILAKVSGKKYKVIKLPLFLMMAISSFMWFLAKAFKIPPLITPSWVKRYNYNWELTSGKAQRELAYSISPFNDAFKNTLNYLVNEKMIADD